jgi:hypothetical protein
VREGLTSGAPVSELPPVLDDLAAVRLRRTRCERIAPAALLALGPAGGPIEELLGLLRLLLVRG